LSLQLGPVSLLDRREKGVHIDVQNDCFHAAEYITG